MVANFGAGVAARAVKGVIRAVVASNANAISPLLFLMSVPPVRVHSLEARDQGETPFVVTTLRLSALS